MRAQIQEMPLEQNALIDTVNATTVKQWNHLEQKEIQESFDAKLVWKNISTPEVSKTGFIPIPLKSFLAKGITTVGNWFERRRCRHQLISLNDHLLKDIGMTRWDVLQEYEKPFWKE